MKKIYSTFTILFFGIILSLVIDGCNDDLEIIQEEIKSGVHLMEYTDTSQIPDIVSTIDRTTGIKKSFWSASKNASSDFWIKENKVIKLVDSVGNESYSFKIISKEYMPQNIFNLIVKKRNDGSYMTPFIMEYEFISGDRFHYAAQEIRKFDGVVNIYSLNGFIDSFGGLSSRGSDPCCEDCGPNPGDSDTGDGSSGDGSSGGSGGPSGTGDGGTTSGSTGWAPYFNGGNELPDFRTGYVEVGVGDFRNLYNFQKGSRNLGKGNSDCPDDDKVLIPINEEEDPIDDKELVDKEKCIYDHLAKTGSNFIRGIMNQFNGETTEFPLKIMSQHTLLNEFGNPINGRTIFRESDGQLTIIISSSRSNEHPALEVARTIMHEFIHADMFRALNTNNASAHDVIFKAIYEAYESGQFNATPQHESMAALYIGSMMESLRKFHQTVLVDDYNYLTNNGANPLSDSFYEALAWRGLAIHNVKAYTDLPQIKKDQLAEALNLYYSATTKTCPEEN